MAAVESYPMKGGDGSFSYTKNSTFQKSASSAVQGLICSAITEKFDAMNFLLPITATTPSATATIRLADLGCSVGPNTFTAMQNVMDTIETKAKSLSFKNPQFQVFFNDHAGNDFNTLFTSLPFDRAYFSAGVPGSFYGRLFPDSSLHFIHSSYSLQWLSKEPKELLNKESEAWNGGRIHYTSAPRGVEDAYARQFSEDMELFLGERARELVVGGMMVLIMPCIPDETVAHSQVPAGIMFDLLGASLVDMAEAGVISQEQVDSFNLPIYGVSPMEMQSLVKKNGRFSIERMELTDPTSARKNNEGGSKTTGDDNTIANHLRAGMEGIFSKHFGVEKIDELFDRFSKKTIEFSDKFKSSIKQGTQLFIVLVKKN
ncbi:probable S-adenosylmethionine-dependent methyltransferase At5g38100 [Chenopodium quinoa]|uniref:probable S-adenosylmethionine-dependent methyltransferase At5g38100 n=1 Tax=Chenopodium quinoa TaxID=63459 RepID=UPI000B77796E|nr:probable S-adenosylmethionine-dependent methyltransferase At5g38100 [Chenopodium quinoa]